MIRISVSRDAYFAYDAVLSWKKRQTPEKALKQPLKPLSLYAVV